MANVFDVGKYSKGLENGGANGTTDSSQGPGGIYHEKQIPNLCGLHAVNNLLQFGYFTRDTFDNVARELDAEERRMGMTFAPGDGNYRPDGFYNVTVLQRTLQRAGFDMSPVVSGDWKKDAIKHMSEVGFIFNKSEHWFCYRRIHDEWFMINSTQYRPVHFKTHELGSAVNFAVADGFGVFVVRGEFPKCALENDNPKLEEAVKGSGGTGPVIIKFGGGGHTLGGSGASKPAPAVEYVDVPCDMCAGVGQVEGLGVCPMCNGSKTQKVQKPKAAMVIEKVEEVVVDPAKPKTKVQLLLPDGSKKAEDFNCDHTVGNIRAVCMKAVGQAVKLKSGFPPKDLEDDTATIETAGLKGAQVRVTIA